MFTILSLIYCSQIIIKLMHNYYKIYFYVMIILKTQRNGGGPVGGKKCGFNYSSF